MTKKSEKKVNLEAAVDTMLDTKQPMKKQRLEDSAKGKKVVLIDRQGEKFAKGGRAMLKGGGICKKGMNKKAIGANS